MSSLNSGCFATAQLKIPNVIWFVELKDDNPELVNERSAMFTKIIRELNRFKEECSDDPKEFVKEIDTLRIYFAKIYKF